MSDDARAAAKGQDAEQVRAHYGFTSKMSQLFLLVRQA